ncbi:SMI1/KNR4 family protein [bacterium]|nr:SMI1/KNR4 family protein [bacterium]
MDWATVFAESYPQPGATDAVIARLVVEVFRPLSLSEIRQFNGGQRNPFPPGDSLYASWRPFDAATWVIPARPLPPSYLSFLRWSNGGEFRTGSRWFQFFPALDVRATLLAYHLPEYMPEALPIALDGGGVFYLLDMHAPATDGEYPVVCADAGSLGWQRGRWWHLADSFLAVCRSSRIADDP